MASQESILSEGLEFLNVFNKGKLLFSYTLHPDVITCIDVLEYSRKWQGNDENKYREICNKISAVSTTSVLKDYLQAWCDLKSEKMEMACRAAKDFERRIYRNAFLLKSLKACSASLRSDCCEERTA